MIKISGNEGEIASELNNSLFFIDYKSKSVCVSVIKLRLQNDQLH